MPTLRQIVDQRTLLAQAPMVKNNDDDDDGDQHQPSPAASHVANHIQDPYGATKDQLDKLNQAKLNYEMEKHSASMQLKPVEDVVNQIKDIHRLDSPDGNELPTGNAMMAPNPDVQQATDQFGPQTPQDGAASQVDPKTGLPSNMGQTPGQMNNNRPSQVGFSPGVSPGPAESVRPTPMGRPGTGLSRPAKVAGMPSMGPGMPGQQQYNPSAPPAPGAGQLPGAKGPGDPKVAGPIKKAQNGGKSNGNGNGKSGGGNRPIKIQVHAEKKTPSGAPIPLANAMGVAKLRSCNTKSMDAEKLRKMTGGVFQKR